MNVPAAGVQHRLAANVTGRDVPARGRSVKVSGNVGDDNVPAFGFKSRRIIVAGAHCGMARLPIGTHAPGCDVAPAGGERDVADDILRLDISGLRADLQAVTPRHVNFVVDPQRVFRRVGRRRARDLRAEIGGVRSHHISLDQIRRAGLARVRRDAHGVADFVGGIRENLHVAHVG